MKIDIEQPIENVEIAIIEHFRVVFIKIFLLEIKGKILENERFPIKAPISVPISMGE